MSTAGSFLACLALAAGLPLAANAQQPAPPSPEQLFDPIASVLQHARCLNCHMIERPFQKDAPIPHAQMVVRGAKDERLEAWAKAGMPCRDE